MVEWPKITAKIIFDLKTCASINFAEKCLLKLFLSKETRLPKMPYRSLKSSTSLKYHLYLFTPLPHPPPPQSLMGGQVRVSLAWPQTAQTGEEEGGMKRRMTFQANQALAALDSDLKACVVGKISFYLQPASLTFFALFLW